MSFSNKNKLQQQFKSRKSFKENIINQDFESLTSKLSSPTGKAPDTCPELSADNANLAKDKA